MSRPAPRGAFPEALETLRRRALLAGAAALALGAVGTLFEPAQFFRSYLFAYLFWVGVALGSLAILMIHHLTGGAWGFVIRRPLEAAIGTLPWLGLLFLPLLLGLHEIYPWAQPDQVAADPQLQHKATYLNARFFIARTAVYFAVWIALGYSLLKGSAEQDQRGDPAVERRLRRLSAAGLILYALTVTFAAIDWVMSLEPHWYSTVYGVLIAMGQWVQAFALAIVAAAWLCDRQPLAAVASPDRFHDLGNLLLAFVMLWAYIQFSQFLVIWSENLPHETAWYLHRSADGWLWVALFIVLFHFAVPFVVLLSRRAKRSKEVLAWVAAALFGVHLVNALWLVAPAFYPAGLHVSWLDPVLAVGLGGVWIWAYLSRLEARPLLPLHDPRLQKLLAQQG